MRLMLFKQCMLLALAALAPLALADEAARVGRVSAIDGQVLLRSGADTYAAALNWPVTGGNLITTPPGAGLEFRAGSSAVRLAGGSELQVVQLDDEHFQLHLHYGSVGVRIANPAALAGFALDVGAARVVLREPGRLRVDAGLARAWGAGVVSV